MKKVDLNTRALMGVRACEHPASVVLQPKEGRTVPSKDGSQPPRGPKPDDK